MKNLNQLSEARKQSISQHVNAIKTACRNGLDQLKVNNDPDFRDSLDDMTAHVNLIRQELSAGETKGEK